jgi:hypothetical protein
VHDLTKIHMILMVKNTVGHLAARDIWPRNVWPKVTFDHGTFDRKW